MGHAVPSRIGGLNNNPGKNMRWTYQMETCSVKSCFFVIFGVYPATDSRCSLFIVLGSPIPGNFFVIPDQEKNGLGKKAGKPATNGPVIILR